MATKKTEKTEAAPKAAAKKTPAKAPKAAKAKAAQGPRHPKARVAAIGTKADLAKSLAASVARSSQDAGEVENQLKTASNQQLLRLQRVVETVKKKWGNRDKLISAIGAYSVEAKNACDSTCCELSPWWSLAMRSDAGCSADAGTASMR